MEMYFLTAAVVVVLTVTTILLLTKEEDTGNRFLYCLIAIPAGLVWPVTIMFSTGFVLYKLIGRFF